MSAVALAGPGGSPSNGGVEAESGRPAGPRGQGFLVSGTWVRTGAAGEAVSVVGQGQGPGAPRRETSARYLDPDLPCAPIPGPGSSQGQG